MAIFDFLRGQKAEQVRQEPKLKRRNYNAAKNSRLFSQWTTQVESPNDILKYSLRALRARSRDLERNNPYVQKFLKTAEKNILGKDGLRLQMRVVNTDGTPDAYANRVIEEAWAVFTKKGNCTMDRSMSFREVEGLFLRGVIRDGAGFLREVRSTRAPNASKYALHLMEVDHIDHDMENTKGEIKIQMGVEHDLWNRVLAYHILLSHPGERTARGATVRLLADNVIHGFIRERVGQLHGVPWIVPAAIRLQMLDGYEEAELVAARAGAAKMGFFTDSDGEQLEGDDEDADGALIQDFEAGVIEVLPPGYDFKSFDPQHPNSGYEQYVNAMLRSIAGALDISFAAFTGDLKDVNFSSIRQGTLSDHDTWRMLQGWLVENLHTRVFEHWLEMSLSNGAINLPLAKFDKFNKPRWQGRGWQWVDPSKDAQANSTRFNQRTKSLSEIAAEEGRDFEEVVQQIKRDEELLAEYGLEVVTDTKSKMEAPANGKADESQD